VPAHRAIERDEQAGPGRRNQPPRVQAVSARGVIGTGRAADRQAALDFGANEFLDLDHDDLNDIRGGTGGVDLVFDVIGGDIQRRSASIIGTIATLDNAIPALNPTQRSKGRTVIRVRP
jgi:hypothetical protein